MTVEQAMAKREKDASLYIFWDEADGAGSWYGATVVSWGKKATVEYEDGTRETFVVSEIAADGNLAW